MPETFDTRESRREIGFPEDVDSWKTAPAEYDGHNLIINGHQVMMDWELNYMQKLAEIAGRNGGSVLEVGYGLGLSAKAIQFHNPSSHTIIECNADVIKKANTDFGNEISEGKVRILDGFWEDVTPNLPDSSFDGILFDTYPLVAEQMHENHFPFFKEAYRLLKPGGVLTYYSDEKTEISPDHLARLVEAGFDASKISSEVCHVNPQSDNTYWRDETLVAPTVVK